ncbi:MAG: hypothetical protein AABW48_01505 [Nanoarchaeota archaeon]
MEKKILFRAIIEVLGKPKEHVQSSLEKYLQNLKENELYSVVNVQMAKLKQQKEGELWSIFAEVEVWAEKVDHLIDFCFDYMPSSIEVVEPAELKLDEIELSAFLNDLQIKLHGVDMLAKQLKTENDMLKINTAALLKNYITVLLKQNNLTSAQLSNFTGVNKDKLEDFLDQLIDEGKIDLKEETYYLKSTKE